MFTGSRHEMTINNEQSMLLCCKNCTDIDYTMVKAKIDSGEIKVTQMAEPTEADLINYKILNEEVV